MNNPAQFEQVSRQRDAACPLARRRELFDLPTGTVYLDGNSLGPCSHAVKQRLAEVIDVQWGTDLIKSWNTHGWINLPHKVGDTIGRLIGAAKGQTVCCDSISVNLFKALSACMTAGLSGRKILSTEGNFPTDLYIGQGLQYLLEESRCELVIVPEEQLLASIDSSVAVVSTSHVNFRSGAIAPLQEIAARAHAHGALVVADLAHSAGVLPVHCDEWQLDFAVGCTYKYLNGGPGAPAFIYMAERHHGKLQQPLFGWFGHRQPFSFDINYQAAEDVSQMLVGTSAILSMSAVDAALEAFDGLDIGDVRAKSMLLGEHFIEGLKAFRLDGQFLLKSPFSASDRGSQLALAHPKAYEICQAWIARGVIADFRAPDILRAGFAPLYNSYYDIYLALVELQNLLRAEEQNDSRWQVKLAVT